MIFFQYLNNKCKKKRDIIEIWVLIDSDHSIMPNNYFELTIQVIFAVKYREALIHDSFREELHKYITGVVRNQGQKMLCINSVSDHIHLLLGLTPEMRISDLVRDIKSESSLFINRESFLNKRFYWQGGFGVFSYSKSQRGRVINYINNQQKHHRRKSFQQEYIAFLDAFMIDYDRRYLFDFFD